MSPTFLARRYLRTLDSISTTEIALGISLLALLAVIVAAFAFTVVTNQDYLFDAGDAAFPPPPTRDTLIAGQMLPSLGLPGWKATGAAQALPPPEADDLADDLAAFGVEAIYRREYAKNAEPTATLTASICQAVSPAQAFGLCRTRRPSDYHTLNVGRNGWIAADGARTGFWKGKYLTLLRASLDADEGAAILPAAAAALADIQLDYGGSFWADRMLPDTDRVADSFRYVHRAAWGHEALNEVFLVDLPAGVTAWVLDTHSPTDAERLYERLETAGSSPPLEDLSEAHAGNGALPARQGPLTIVAWGEGELAFSRTGRYVQGAYGHQRTALVTAATSVYERVSQSLAGAAHQAIGGPADASDSPFPHPGLDGWQTPARANRFTADNLYVKIDGRADAYLQFHVVSLTFGTYVHTNDSRRAVDVYWYDMGEPVNAYGIYKAEASPESTLLDLGREAYEVGGAVFFCKGAGYVQVLPTDAADADAAQSIARELAKQIEGGGESPWAETLLPEPNQLQGSFAYIARDAFGLGFLVDVYTADYNIEGERVTLFIHRAPDEAAALLLLDEYGAFFRDFGRVTWEDGDSGRRIIAGDVSGLVDVVFAKGRYLGGVAGAEDADLAKKAAMEFHDGLSAD